MWGLNYCRPDTSYVRSEPIDLGVEVTYKSNGKPSFGVTILIEVKTTLVLSKAC